MSSRVGRVAVVAGLMAFGVTEGASAQADEPGVAVNPPTVPPPPPNPAAVVVRSGRRPSAKKATAEAGLVATLPGFQMLPDGSSRLFVELTRTANVTEKRDPRTLTYVIHGAHVAIRNNENALVTVHFNTPVTRARLLPVRGDVVFSVELRADSAPVWRMVDNAEGGTSILQVDFPKGSFLPVGEASTTEAVIEAEPVLPRPVGATDPPVGQGHAHSGRHHSAPPPATSGDN